MGKNFLREAAKQQEMFIFRLSLISLEKSSS